MQNKKPLDNIEKLEKNNFLSRPLYLDYQATTPVDPSVLEAMLPYFSTHFGNPHSRTHAYGWEAENACEKARAQVASLIAADPKDIVFTSGATESNNLAIKGLANFFKEKKSHIITTSLEHKCLLESCRSVSQDLGYNVTHIPVHTNGIVDLKALEAAISDQTLMVSIIAVSNEIGVVQPLAEIGKLCKEKGVYFHTDAAQAVGKIPLDVDAMQIDLLSISGHKIYAPKGIGALYVRRKNPRVRLKALLSGGGQERNMRSGTLSPALCVGLGKACALAQENLTQEGERIKSLFQYMLGNLRAKLPEVFLNGDETKRVPHNLNISFAGVEGEGLMMGLKDLAISSGSACTSASLEPSYVLEALGVSEDLAHTSLRISFGRTTTKEDVVYATKRIIQEVERLRKMSPLWELHLEGISPNTIQWAQH